MTSLLTLPNWTWPGLISVRREGSLPGELGRALVWWLMWRLRICQRAPLLHLMYEIHLVWLGGVLCINSYSCIL